MTKERYTQYGYEAIFHALHLLATCSYSLHRYYARDQVTLRVLSFPVRLTVGYWLYRDVGPQNTTPLVSCTIS